MIKLLKIALLSFAAGCLLLPAAALPARAAEHAAVVTKAKEKKRDKKKTQGDTVKKATPYENCLRTKRPRPSAAAE